MLERSRNLLTAIGMAIVAAVAGCTAQPLYSTSVAPEVGGNNTSVAAALGQVNVAPVTTREAQVVRNELIFLLSGGRGNPAGASYDLTLRAYPSSQSATAVNTVGVEQAPTSAIMSFTGTYTLTESGTRRVIGNGTRHATALYDFPVNQPFAEQRAVRDAQDRSARELAALLAAAIAADLATGRKAAAP